MEKEVFKNTANKYCNTFANKAISILHFTRPFPFSNSFSFFFFLQLKMDAVTMTRTVRYRLPITCNNLIELLFILIKDHSKCKILLFSF